MAMICLVYVSSAVRLFTDDELAALLYQSRDSNKQTGITGMLLYMGGNFMQAIEGEDEAVAALREKIYADPRHTQVTTLLNLPIARRRFADWSMAFSNIDRLPHSDREGFSTFLNSVFCGKMESSDYIVFRLLDGFRERLR
jgi:FAD-dependent sensor of blue light